MRALHKVALLGALSLGGCLELEQKITLAADGSGRQEVRLEASDELLVELRRRQPAAQLGASGDPAALFSKDKATAELRAAGLELVQHEAARNAGRRSVALSATFDDFEVLRRSPLCGSAAEWELTEGPKPGLAKLTLYPQGKVAWTQARKKAAELKGRSDPLIEDYFRKQQSKLRGLDVVFRFVLPGDVLMWTRNMERVSPREVVASVSAAQLRRPADLIRRLAPRYEVIFDARATRLLRGAAASAPRPAAGR